jgi:negative regulator of replication initiation
LDLIITELLKAHTMAEVAEVVLEHKDIIVADDSAKPAAAKDRLVALLDQLYGAPAAALAEHIV